MITFEGWMRRQGMGHVLGRDENGEFTSKPVLWWEKIWKAAQDFPPLKQAHPTHDRSAWFALAMNAAADLEDAARCLHDQDARRAALGAATHVRDMANTMWSFPVEPEPKP